MSAGMYVWGELVDDVKAMLTADAEIHGGEGLIDASIKSGAANLQRYIPSFKRDLTHAIGHTQAEPFGACSVVPLPAYVRPKEWYVVPTDANTEATYASRVRMTDKILPWADRFKLSTQGGCPLEAGLAVNEDRTEAWLYPQLDANWQLILHYEGDRLNLQTNTPTAFPRDPLVVECLYSKVKGAILRDFEKDSAEAARWDFEPSERNPVMGRFQQLRRDLWSEYAVGMTA